MAKTSGKLAAALLSLVLALCVLPLSATAEDSAHTEPEEGIAPHYVECPRCGNTATVSTTWTGNIEGSYEVKCVHKPHGTDLMGTMYGTTYENCTSTRCSYHIQCPVSIPVLRTCGGYYG